MGQNLFKQAYQNKAIMSLYSYVPFELRCGRAYRQELNIIKHNEYLSRSQLEQLHILKLKEVLRDAKRNVSFYKNIIGDFELDSTVFWGEFEKIPFLTRKDVFNHFSELRSSAFHKFNSYTGLTGGTTGHPLQLLFSVKSHFTEWAYIHAMWSRIGYRPECRRVLLTTMPSYADAKWQKNHHHNELKILGHDPNNDNIHDYMNVIYKFKPEYIYGMPSALVIWAKVISECEISFPKISGAFCGSEAISISQRKVISEIFSCKVLSWYGQTEKVVLGGECELSNQYHLFPEYGYTELVDDQGKVINKPNIQGEIVGTGFINSAMPLIRYKTGDYASYAEGDCECGRNCRRLINVVGRRDIQYLILEDNTKFIFSALDLQKDIFKNIYQWQFVQEYAGQTQVRVIANDRFSCNDCQLISAELRSQCFGKMVFQVESVDELIRTHAGKVNSVIQNIRI